MPQPGHPRHLSDAQSGLLRKCHSEPNPSAEIFFFKRCTAWHAEFDNNVQVLEQ